ncbi:hypothetical protein Fcan01_28639 [Folsomia candida]|uniref:Uncharacterized protein n=1 Tax=Folsomia candida TaxID=158441 RepID=A0A226CT18_FOLCA|nr:hypothetical protein Fcan01_28639 [Folsomia candida]
MEFSSETYHKPMKGAMLDQSEYNSDSEFNFSRKPLEDTATELDDINKCVWWMMNDDDGEGSLRILSLNQFDTIIENHERRKRLRPIFRKRMCPTQNFKSPSIFEQCPSTTEKPITNGQTTASSASHLILSLFPKLRNIFRHIPSSSKTLSMSNLLRLCDELLLLLLLLGGEDVELGRNIDPIMGQTGIQRLNILNMRFTNGRRI